VDFTQSVSFLDVSEPARPEFAERPRLEAKFPADFFYPFVSSQVRKIAVRLGAKVSMGG
jgi:hypothetical protein